MPGPTVADVWRVYVKPSMDGRMIIRKKTVNRKSLKVIERNKKLMELAGTDRHPVKIAIAECLKDGYGYVGKDGKKHCPWKIFIRYLRKAWAEAGLTKGGAAAAGVIIG